MNFPPLLPPLDIVQGFSASEADNVIRTPMDTGPAKQRRRSTAAPLIWKMGHSGYDKPELAVLLQFFREDTAHGALPFDMEDPVMGGTMRCRFAGPPTWSAKGNDWYSVEVTLEILP